MVNELDLIKGAVQLGQAGIFFGLYWDAKTALKAASERYEAEFKRLYEMRVNELKLIARIPTELDDPSLK